MMCKIAVIDTGLDIGNKYLKCKRIDGVCIRRADKEEATYSIVQYTDDPMCIQDNIGHGTAICGIIASHNPNAEIFMVKLFDWDSLQADEELLCFALEYILNNVDCHILNLSLGLCLSENSRLYELCGRLRQNKKYLVSAFDNNGAISYPAAFDTVIGVTTGNECYHNNDFYIVNNSMVNVCAKGRAQRLVWLRDSLLVGSGNSYACAHITGILSQYINRLDPKVILMERALGSIDVGEEKKSAYMNPVAKYKKAVVFPFNKEMHSIVRFYDQLRFELVDIYDLKYSAHVGAFTNDLLKSTCPRNYCIRNIEVIDWDSFDTFILGHTDEFLQILNIPDFKQNLIYQIIDHGKNLYAYDDLSEYDIPEDKKDLVYYPKITQADVPVCPFGKLYRQGKPILGVFGTSSRQGKFTLQLKLRAEFFKRGYRVAQIGTEPNALLFGMDVVFPVGYHSSVSINRKDTVAYLNRALHEISSDVDIVLVGGQSGTIIRDEGNLDNYNFTQVDFLYATQPDAVILCIHVFDDLEIINRTKQFIEAAVGCRVLALVAFPFHYKKEDTSYQQLIMLNDSEFQIYKEILMKQFELPVYLMSDDFHIQALMEQTIDYFSQS